MELDDICKWCHKNRFTFEMWHKLELWGQSSPCAAVVGGTGAARAGSSRWAAAPSLPELTGERAEPTGSSEQGPSGAGGDGSGCLQLSTASHLNTPIVTTEYKITQRRLILAYIILGLLCISRSLWAVWRCVTSFISMYYVCGESILQFKPTSGCPSNLLAWQERDL